MDKKFWLAVILFSCFIAFFVGGLSHAIYQEREKQFASKKQQDIILDELKDNLELRYGGDKYTIKHSYYEQSDGSISSTGTIDIFSWNTNKTAIVTVSRSIFYGVFEVQWLEHKDTFMCFIVEDEDFASCDVQTLEY